MEKIGFIGLSIMGSRMAANLLKEGHAVVVHNRSKEKAGELIAKGAGWAESPAEVGSPCSVVFAMLSTLQVVGETAERLLSSVKPKSLWIGCSFSHEMAAKLSGIKR